MGFNKRFLSRESIERVAALSFKEFDRHMTSADAYIFDDHEASMIWEEYLALKPDQKEKFHLTLQEKSSNVS